MHMSVCVCMVCTMYGYVSDFFNISNTGQYIQIHTILAHTWIQIQTYTHTYLYHQYIYINTQNIQYTSNTYKYIHIYITASCRVKVTWQNKQIHTIHTYNIHTDTYTCMNIYTYATDTLIYRFIHAYT